MASSRGEISFKSRDFSKIKKTNKNFNDEFWRVFYYAHYELSNIELKKEVLKYLRTIKHPLFAKVKELDDCKFTSIGKFCYILNNGGDLIGDSLENLIPSIEKLIALSEVKPSKNENDTDDTELKPIINIQQRLKQKALEVAAEIDGWIDDFCSNKKVREVEEFTVLFNSHGLKVPHMRHLISYFESGRKELLDIASGDSQLKEGYSNFTKPEIRWYIQFYDNLFQACQNSSIRVKKVKKVTKRSKNIDKLFDTSTPEEKSAILDKVKKASNKTPGVPKVEKKVKKESKPVSTLVDVSKLKYMKEDATLGLKSVNPADIIGCKSFWIYNTYTCRLGQYVANSSAGLSVKGTTIVDFSTNSVEKILRSPADALATFAKINNAKYRDYLDSILATATPLRSRMNKHCIILKVEK